MISVWSYLLTVLLFLYSKQESEIQNSVASRFVILDRQNILKMPRLVISALGLIASLIVILSLAHSTYSVDVNEFLAQREKILAEESFRILGGSITLNADEQLVNNMLMNAKTLEYDQSFSNLDFAPANHFFVSKPLMLQSEVFKFIQQMPKGKRNSLSTYKYICCYTLDNNMHNIYITQGHCIL
jgi:hypothetical protein